MVKMPFEKNKPVSSIEVEKLIDKAAPVKDDLQKDKSKYMMINIRMTKKMVEQIDQKVAKSIGLSRTSWIVRALDRQLKISNKED